MTQFNFNNLINYAIHKWAILLNLPMTCHRWRENEDSTIIHSIFSEQGYVSSDSKQQFEKFTRFKQTVYHPCSLFKWLVNNGTKNTPAQQHSRSRMCLPQLKHAGRTWACCMQELRKRMQCVVFKIMY